ncbi:MAG: hypothetical protein ACOCW8_02780 [bacterium]
MLKILLHIKGDSLYKLAVIFLVFAWVPLSAQKEDHLAEHIEIAKNLDSAYYSDIIDSLELTFGNNKEIPENFKLPLLTALTFYPELEDTRISLKVKKIRTTMNVRPALKTIFFRKKNKREYIIRVNLYQHGSNILTDLPFNALVGLFSHELSHVVDYSGKNMLGLIGTATAYTINHSKRKYEKKIDMCTINRGLGYQLYSWAYYILFESDAPESYKEYKRKIYLSPNEILSIIEEY